MSSRLRKFGLMLSLLSMSTSIMGCSSGAAGFDTPEACFAAIKAAAAKKDTGGVFDCMTEESQAAIAGAMVLMGGMMKMMSGMAAMGGPEAVKEMEAKLADVNAALEKHGVTEETLKDAAPGPETANDPNAMIELGNTVKDKRAFFVDMVAALEKTGPEEGGFTDKLDGEIKDVKIDGDKATATLVTSTGEEELDFRKTASGWKLHADLDKMAAQDGPGPGPGPDFGPPPAGEDLENGLPAGLDLEADAEVEPPVETAEPVETGAEN